MIIAFDTETTGKANFNLPANHPSQPHLVQIGAILVDDQFSVRGEMNMIVKPDGWTIPAEASGIHGITQEVAESCGVDKSTALNAFVGLSSLAERFVCHNFDFDYLVMSSFSERVSDVVGRFAHMNENSFCTMKAMTPICKFKGAYSDFKWPRLNEAYWHAFQEVLEGAHDAMADVRACLRLYRWIQYQTGVIV